MEQPNPGPSRLSGDARIDPAQTNEARPQSANDQAVDLLAPKSAGLPPTRSSSSSPSKATARSEASAKMRAALSASSSPIDPGTAKFSGPSFSAAQMRVPNSDRLDVPPLASSSHRSPTLPAGLPPSPSKARIEAHVEPAVQPPADVGQNGTASPAAPLMSASGRTASTPGIRSRSPPRMRAQTNQHLPPSIPSLSAMAAGNVPAAPAGFAVPYHGSSHQNTMTPAAYERHTAELTNCIIAFLSPILPTEEEYRIKEATRRQLERLASKVSPGAKLLAFGSMANGFALRNSDMDLCCLTSKKDGKPATQHTASELVEILSQLIREETDFNVMPLPRARIPIIKISRAPTPELPYEIACDIGFENRLALENTRLLLSYAMVDPPRLRTLVLFLKVWSKRRKLNSPYTGTLSSYGYTLLALYFLTHVKRPAVLPNLQRVPPTRQLKPEELELDGHNIYFYDDVATLRKEWTSQNTENVGELLIEFFRYFSKEFSYAKDVISLRTEGGLLSKDSKSWNSELCIEDPFQMGYNVSRTVTKDGLYTIRGEFMRASRILMNPKSQRVSALIAELCEEREDGLSRAPDGPYPRPRYQNGPPGVDGRSYRDMYANPRRYDSPTFSGYGGSFAFEQMARGLGQGVAFPPTTAMLAPLSRNHGLSPKPQPPRFAHAQEPVISSGQSDTGPPSSYDGFSRASIGHASARTSPSFKHALPSVLHPSNGPNAQEAFAYGAEISFGPEPVNATRDDLSSGPRTKTARSLSESLNRSKSLPRAAAAAAAAANGEAAGATNGVVLPVTSLPPGPGIHAYAKNAGSSDELEGQMAGLSVAPNGETARRLSSSSHASSSMHSEGVNGGPHHYSTSPTWTFSQPGNNQRRGSQSSSFHNHPHPHGHSPASHAYGQVPQHQHQHQQQQQYQSYHQLNVLNHQQPPPPHQQQFQAPDQQHQQQLRQQHPHMPPTPATMSHQPSQQQQQLPQVQDTRAMLQEYLRRASENAEPADARALGPDNDDASSVISEATLDELARLSALDSEETTSPQMMATQTGKGAGAAAVPPSPPRTSLRLPSSIIEHAKNRRKAEQKAASAAPERGTATSAVRSKEQQGNE
ncbi:related to caffeine-induced death protein 1 Cid1 [Pseudozyma flocculosa]|uniref:polynucleotide adenylyltransferase n=1 Tax=Pseudozyma flocculosa TaxID=84751 RepID=A0A5C3EXT5_9BASI|nr:related to caffeine-induced death protein 1 Cid1 [Pseudozyma flocculosa]